MNSQSIYSRKTMGLDNRVWFVMIGMMVLLESFYIYKIVKPQKCTPFTFSITTYTPHPDGLFKKGETISFTATIDNENIIWDFDDNSSKGPGRLITHTFSSSGEFNVKASLSSNCESDTKQITIKTDEPPPLEFFKISGKDSSEVGKEVVFLCLDSASSYDWSVKDYPDITAKGSGTDDMRKFIFPLPDTYTIECILNKDKNKVATHKIHVKAKRVTVPVAPKPIEFVCNGDIEPQDFAGLLRKVMNRALSSETFGQYLCHNDNTPVLVNGKKTFLFGEFCQKLSSVKESDKEKINIIVHLDRKEGRIEGSVVKNVVQKISVSLKRKKGRWIGRDKTVFYELK